MTSRLVVVRHAKSDYPWGVDDHERPLNERGRRDAPALGGWLDAHVTWPAARAPIAVVSTARRTQLTWGMARARMSDRWEHVDVVDEPRVYEAAVRDLLEAVQEAAAEHDTVILVGHNPGLAQLVLYAAAPSALREEATSKFPTSAVAVLESPLDLGDALVRPGGFEIASFAVPRG
jgi:phosphohistidine phosphatase